MSKKLKKLDHTKLALGESTGHYHEALGEQVSLWGDDTGTMVLDAPHGATVTHQEHATVTVPSGKYDRRIVREYEHFAEEVREVRD